MTWLKHECWFCGHRSRDVDFIAGDSNYQCVDRDACLERRYDKFPWEASVGTTSSQDSGRDA